ncbi:MAG: hypothetical protein I8H67_09510 [Comamonadaceae bacterium]|jgi:hypothetical protein|nr:hypothetical protein [Comamonadaceae bacterium]MBH2044030.1 hypothetical protein [Comamonadaceae bacterium]
MTAASPNEKVAGGYHTTTATSKERSGIFSCGDRESNTSHMGELITQLARIAAAMEQQNTLLNENTNALLSISCRIEDVMGCLP